MVVQFLLTLILLMGGVQSAAASVSLGEAAASGPDDLLLVANISFLPTNLDGSIRLARPSNGMTVSDCMVRDMTANRQAWSATIADRKRGKALDRLLDVPTIYRTKGLESLRPWLDRVVKSYLRLELGLTGSVDFSCDDYAFLRSQGVVENLYRYRYHLFLVPAFLAEAMSYEIGQQPIGGPEAKAYGPDRYRVIKRFTPADLKQLEAKAQTAKQAQIDLGADYSRVANRDPAAWVGALGLARRSALPTVCLLQTPRQRTDAEAIYSDQWMRNNREAELARLRAEGDSFSQAAARSLSQTQKMGETRMVASLNDAFVKMSGALPCDVFIGSPKDVLTLRDGLMSQSRRELILGPLSEEATLLETYAVLEGYASYANILFARSIGARREQVNALLAQGISNKQSYDALLGEIAASSYANEPGLTLALTYLADKSEAKKRGLSVIAERERRFFADRELAEQAQTRRRNEQQAFDRDYPFEAIISCGTQQRHLSAIQCFAGDSSSLNTQLEVRSGDQYGFYQYFELQRAGSEDREQGLKIPLQQPFSIKAQNASSNMTLTVKVVEKKSGRTVFIESVGQHGTIGMVY